MQKSPSSNHELTIGYVSDLHLEKYIEYTNSKHYKHDNHKADWMLELPEPKEKMDVLAFVGDTCEVRFESLWNNILTKASKLADNVLVIPGNHEYWKGNNIDSIRKLIAICHQHPNITLLSDRSITIKGISFYGTCLWTNYENDLQLAKEAAGHSNRLGFVDKNFNKVTWKTSGYRKMSPENLIELSNFCASGIETWLKQNQDTPKVLLSHYPPLKQSSQTHWDNYSLNSNDSLNLNLKQLSRLKAALITADHHDMTDILHAQSDLHLIHGHTHLVQTYTTEQGLTVHCNPRGSNSVYMPTYEIKTFKVSA